MFLVLELLLDQVFLMVGVPKYFTYLVFSIALLWFERPANSAPNDRYDGVWSGAIVCGDKKSEKSFRTPRKIRIKNGRIKMRRGQPNRDRFEVWEGVVSPTGTVLIFGRYFWKVEKPLWFKGQVEETTLTAVGARGPKICRLKLSKKSSKNKRKSK